MLPIAQTRLVVRNDKNREKEAGYQMVSTSALLRNVRDESKLAKQLYANHRKEFELVQTDKVHGAQRRHTIIAISMPASSCKSSVILCAQEHRQEHQHSSTNIFVECLTIKKSAQDTKRFEKKSKKNNRFCSFFTSADVPGLHVFRTSIMRPRRI